MKHCSWTATQTAATFHQELYLLSKGGKIQKGVENCDHKLFCGTQNENAMCRKKVTTPILQLQISVLMVHNGLKHVWRKYCIIQSCNKFLQAIFSSSVQPLAPLESFSALKIKIKFRNSRAKFSSFSKGLGEDYISFLHVQNKFPLFKSCSIDQSQRQVCFFPAVSVSTTFMTQRGFDKQKPFKWHYRSNHFSFIPFQRGTGIFKMARRNYTPNDHTAHWKFTPKRLLL